MAAMTDTYCVTAKRWEKGWELHIEGVGATQARKLREAETMARDLIARREDLNSQSFGLVWRFELGDELDAEVKDARAAVADVETAQRDAAAKSRKVAARLKAAGLAGNEVAKVLGVSPQRVSQLLEPSRRIGMMALISKSTTKR
jgi:hypothetical protein